MSTKTTPIALRISNVHLTALARIGRQLGLNRSAAIKLAIAEFIGSRGK